MPNLIQRGKVRSQVINVPEGLPELLSDITREVLRCQPTTECLCHFIIDYLQSVINTRDKARIAKSIIDRALRIVDDVIADLCACNISPEKSDYMCEAMEECFRRFLGRRRCEKSKTKEIIKFNDFDMLDELIQKCKFNDDELKLTKPVIEAAYQKFINAYMMANDNADGTDSLYQYFRERESARMEQRQKEEAAIKIQSMFRGYLVRRELFLEEPIKHPPSVSSSSEIDQNELEMAALKIQRFFRRYISDTKVVGDEKEGKEKSEDICTPVSDISLTARPANHHDVHDEEQNIEENHNEKEQTEVKNSETELKNPEQDENTKQIEENI